MPIVKLEGGLEWIKTDPASPDEYKGKSSWSVGLIPTKDSLDKIRDMQSDGIKNVVKRGDEPGEYHVKFSRPVDKRNKAGKVLKVFGPVKTYMPDGTVYQFDKSLAYTGHEGWIEIDFYEHAVKGGGKAHAARLESVHLTKVEYYDGE